MKRKTIGIYHSADLDGLGSAAVMKLKYPDIELIGYNYNNPLPHIPKDSKIIMCDVSFPMEDMFKVAALSFSFLWIDHHKSAIDDYQKHLVANPQDRSLITPVHRVGVGACELAQEYLHGAPNLAIFLLGKYDTWRQEDEDFEGVTYTWDDALNFQMGMRLPRRYQIEQIMHIHNQTDLDRIFLSGELDVTDRIMHEGGLIREYQDGQNKRVSTHDSFKVELLGYKILACNTDTFNSGLFNAVWDEEKYDMMIPFKMRRNGTWKFSVYTTKDSVDCSAFAKEFGGGGHQKASGFMLDDLPWN